MESNWKMKECDLFKKLTSSPSGINEKRVGIAVMQIANSFSRKYQAIKEDEFKLQIKLESLTDLGPDDSVSLRPVSKDFDADQFVNEILAITDKQEVLRIKFNDWEKAAKSMLGASYVASQKGNYESQ